MTFLFLSMTESNLAKTNTFTVSGKAVAKPTSNLKLPFLIRFQCARTRPQIWREVEHRYAVSLFVFLPRDVVALVQKVNHLSPEERVIHPHAQTLFEIRL